MNHNYYFYNQILTNRLYRVVQFDEIYKTYLYTTISIELAIKKNQFY